MFLAFIHVTLLVPGYVIIKKTRLLASKPGIELVFGYLVTILLFGALAVFGYALGFSLTLSRIVCWLIILWSFGLLIYKRYYIALWEFRFPLICLVAMSLLSTAFVGLTFGGKYTILPDPMAEQGRNYHVLNVKILNIAQTQANDNYIPYRQAQFMINRSDPGKDSFIGEWGVTFFQRTPLMGAVTASYFNLLNEKPPIAYTWSRDGLDPHHTYLQFQLIAHVLNALFIVPAFFLLKKLFNKKTALLACLFLVPSQFFLYNAVFSWPKSLVAFFVLVTWLLLLENKLRYTVLAGTASGVAYLTHDLAVLYLGTSVLLLLWHRRIKDTAIFLGLSAVFAIPWLLASTIFYHKASSFILYPISTVGIPQPEQKQQLIHQFFQTSPLRLIFIRIENFVYLFTPYQLFTSEGGQDASRRIWALGLFSIPGSIGFGLLIPVFIATVKRLRGVAFWILVVGPVVFSTIVIGWPKGLGSLHFAEAVVVLLTGLSVYYLSKQKKVIWLLLAYAANSVQLLFFVTYSYGFHVSSWLDLKDIILSAILLGLMGISGYGIYSVSHKRSTKVSRFMGLGSSG